MGKREKILLLVGPTAVGKTALSILLAKKLQGEIVSADSVQIYKGLDIGSAKPTAEEKAGIAHHLIDIADVDEPDFSVAKYQSMAQEAINQILAAKKLPIVVGGTGLYIHALVYPLHFTKISGDPELRKKLQEEEMHNPGILYQKLEHIDACRASKIHPNDQKRIVRALEIFALSGAIPSAHGDDFQNETNKETLYDPLIIGLTMDRSHLYQRIDKRVDIMMESGLLEEVRQFEALPPLLPALQALGYKQLLQYFSGNISLDEAVTAIKRETRHLAKRQWTWFKRDKRIQWFDMDAFSDIDALVKHIEALWYMHTNEI